MEAGNPDLAMATAAERAKAEAKAKADSADSAGGAAAAAGTRPAALYDLGSMAKLRVAAPASSGLPNDARCVLRAPARWRAGGGGGVGGGGAGGAGGEGDGEGWVYDVTCYGGGRSGSDVRVYKGVREVSDLPGCSCDMQLLKTR